ncbi:hypothetical protein C1H46_014878 [Malus baccata]|uniref:PROP1-like PPR domain-containing protein n=1 Tax=Malus baccata TaxID=106549 RepID=A0A540MMV4_MALBA|nr:hypothetical protein C1H46_014878 [Malus baccata]
MQALVTWEVPQVGFELGSSCKFRTRSRRKKIGVVGFPVCNGGNGDVLLGSEGFNGSRKFGFGCGCFSGHSRLKLARFCEPKKGSFGGSFVVAWALEEQAIGNEVLVEEATSENRLSGECEGEGVVDHRNVDGRKGGDGNDDDEIGIRGQGENWEQRNEKIDVRALALSLQFAKTADDVEEVLKDKGDLPLQVFSSIIRGFGRDRLMDSAFATVEWLKRKKEETNGFVTPNLFIYNSLLGAVKQSGQFGEIDKVLSDMTREGVVPNVVTYNTKMAIYIERGQSMEALHVLEEIQEKGLIPSSVSYSTALLAYQRMQDGNGALKFFVEFRGNYRKGHIGKDADVDWEEEFVKLENFTKRVCYQVMRRWLVRDDNLTTNVLKLLTEMDIAGVPLGRAEHERLLWACTREEHYIVAKDLYSRIREKHSDISLAVCNHTIWLMGKAKKWWAALEIYEDMLDKGPQPNNMSYELIVSHFNVLLSAARKRAIWKWGVRLLNKMEEKGLKPRSKEWNAVLVACSKAAETSAAVKIFKRMVEQGQKPTILSYGALLSALEKGKRYDEARQVWEHMLKVGLKPNLSKRLGPVLKIVNCLCVLPIVLILWPVVGIVGSILGGAAFGFFSPIMRTFEAVGEGKTDKLYHCFYDGTWSTVKRCFNIVRDTRDFFYYTYFSLMDDLQQEGLPGAKYYEIRVLYLPGAIILAVLGFLVDMPVISFIAICKCPYMLFKGWHRLFHDLIGREGPFLETICVPFAGLAILVWPLAVVGAVLASIVAGIFLGAYAGVIVYQESSFWLGLRYIVASLAIYDEYCNDILDMPEGSCFPRPKYRKKAELPQTNSRTPSFSRPGSFRGAPSRSPSFATPIIELKPLELIDSLFKECKHHGEKMVADGTITLQDLEDAKSSQGDNGTEITTTNRPKDTFFDWFFNPLLIIKDQIRAENLSEAEEAYLCKLVLLTGDPLRLKQSNIGSPPESERKQAELDALARRLQGITKSISRYPTFRRRFENLVNTISDDLAQHSNGSSKPSHGPKTVPRSKSAFTQLFSQKSFSFTKTSNHGTDPESGIVRDLTIT